MAERFRFVAGLPRSGSTLLCNILCQNPAFHATGTSGAIDVLVGIKNGWANVPAFRAMAEVEMYELERQVLGGTLAAFYAKVQRPVVFDKNRGWPNQIEMLEQILPQPVKILLTVRNLADVMASWELRWRETMALGNIPAPNGTPTSTVEERVKWYASAGHPIGFAFNTIRDAFSRGHGEKMHVVDFDALTRTPKATLAGVYEFLGEPEYEHDFAHVPQVTQEDDRVHGFIGLHTIRTKVEPVPSRWHEVLGSLGEGLSKQRCW